MPRTAMAMQWIGAAAWRRLSSRALSSQRLAMFTDGDQARVTCVCVVNGVSAGFQIDCGSTYTQISSALAPERVPRHGLGSASCLGRRLWFPTCEVMLAPVDSEGGPVQPMPADEPTLHSPLSTRVQIGSSNLLGLHELRRWRVALSFAPEAHHCSMQISPKEEPAQADPAPLMDGGDTVLLADALRAASALNEGTIEAEEGRCHEYPWLLDTSKVIDLLKLHEARASPSWPGFSMWRPSDALISVPRLGLPPSRPVTADVLFGTADALLSDSEIPPLLGPPQLIS